MTLFQAKYDSGAAGYMPADKTDDAIAWIKEQGENPWFLWFAFNLPHIPPPMINNIFGAACAAPGELTTVANIAISKRTFMHR